MNILTTPALQPKSAFEPFSSDGPSAGQDVARLVRSAAHAAECAFAVYYLLGPEGFQAGVAFGVDGPLPAPASERALLQATRPDTDGLMIINDLVHEPGFTKADTYLLGDELAPVRFMAAARVHNQQGAICGALMIADPSPRAGLSPAKTYVLRTLAAQLTALLELQGLRETTGQPQSGGTFASGTERLRLLESVVVNANDAVLITEAEPFDLPGPRIVYCNAAFTRTTGYTEAEILGRTPRLLQSSGTDRIALAKLRAALSRWEPVEVELLNVRKDGVEFWVELSIVPVANEEGWYTHWVSVQRDVSDRKAAEETATRVRIAEAENQALEAEIEERRTVEAQLLYAAFHDDLTKLRNRAFFMDRLIVAMNRARSDARYQCAVLFLDLDKFKLVNDSLGHRAGDLLLMEVAERLRICTRPQDTIARVGGDEFALLVEDIEDMATVTTLARRIIETIRRPLWIGKQEIFTSCSVGVVQATIDHAMPEELLRDADIAMYQAKRHDTGSFAVFAGATHDSAVVALELRTDLRNALTRGEFFLNYQPICNPLTGAITGLEALVRWQHPQRGVVLPGDFITMAEETGFIREIGRRVLREACRNMRQWSEQFPSLALRLNVNASGEELKDRCFTSEVRETLASTGLDPRSLQLEVTESIFLQNPEVIGAILSTIRSLGVRIALDDFGMGYSSLSYLDRYQMDTIKIDKSFIACMLTRQRTMAIVETIVKLGKALDLEIIAEGVERHDQLEAIRATGCTSVQGFFLGRPMSADQVSVALAKQQTRQMASSLL